MQQPDSHFASNLASASQRKNLAILAVMVLVPLVLIGLAVSFWVSEESVREHAAIVTEGTPTSTVTASEVPGHVDSAPSQSGSSRIESAKHSTTREQPPSADAHPSSVMSSHSSVATTIAVYNEGETTVDVYWIDFDGHERPYFSLGPGKRQTQETYVGHSWVVRDKSTTKELLSATAKVAPTAIRVGEGKEEPEIEAAASTLALLGAYENRKYGDSKNDWHYVTLSAAGKDTLSWSNRAGVSWTLTATSDPNTWSVGADSPYFGRGHRSADVEFHADGRVIRLTGPGGEWYYRVP